MATVTRPQPPPEPPEPPELPPPVSRVVRYARPLTPEEFERLPEAPDGWRRELVEGAVVEVAPVGNLHGVVVAELLARLRDHVRRHGGRRLGQVTTEVGHRVDPGGPIPVRGPDVAFRRADRLPPPGHPGYVEGAPDLAGEVRSPNDDVTAEGQKLSDYLRAGALLVWLIDPPRGAWVYGPGDDLQTREAPPSGSGGPNPAFRGPDDDLDGGPVLPGFRVRVRDLWEDA